MLEGLRDNHTDLLATVFAVAVVAAAWLEVFVPRRIMTAPRARRWTANLSLGAFNILLFNIAVPVGAFTAALLAEERGWGVLNQVPMPDWLAIPLGILAVDLLGYLVHRFMHGVPLLWRLHQVHHSDIEIDFTTAARHHPFEALVTFGLLFGAVFALGIPPESVAIQQIALTGFDVAAHGNLRASARLDGWLRWVFVTPDMHAVHHSALRQETDSNYGMVLSLWDRWLGTYVAAPVGGSAGMTIGLEHGRAAADQRLDRLFLAPFAWLARAPTTGAAAAPD
jgi:sterol desaturase/sphingolipid hydroxylase (fatty acid hydroxylase superfamily)